VSGPGLKRLTWGVVVMGYPSEIGFVVEVSGDAARIPQSKAGVAEEAAHRFLFAH